MSDNIYGLFEKSAAASPDAPALRCGGKTLSFRELESDCRALAAGLAAAGVKPGHRAILLAPPESDFFALAFALFRAGAVVVLVDPGMGMENVARCIETARPDAFVGSVKAHLGRLTGRWGKDTLKTLVTTGPRILRSEMQLDYIRSLGKNAPSPSAPCGETAAIMFTSGATGRPKGAVYTHSMLYTQAGLLAERFAIKPGEVSVATFPLFGLFDLALGQTLVIPAMDTTKPAKADPEEIIRCINENKAAQLFGSPALLETLSRHAAPLGIKLPSLKRVISCGAPLYPELVERMRALLPENVVFTTPYGATEALPVSAITASEILSDTGKQAAQGMGICVGLPWTPAQVELIQISDEPIAQWSDSLRAAPGQPGEVAVRGPMVSREYFGLEKETAYAKIPCGDGTFFHRMGDIGRLDDKGRLWFWGRKAHRVRAGQGDMFTVPCEGVFNAHKSVRRTALVGVGEPGKQVPVLCVELEQGVQPTEALKGELLDMGAKFQSTASIKRILFHPSFPVDPRHNSKIFRDRLAAWAASELSRGLAQ
ncbi:MAG: AMP-binding protein [Elusimicrobia bacterium]|nr:AMP-binding protein [Elusimicrobiota bacterium]